MLILKNDCVEGGTLSLEAQGMLKSLNGMIREAFGADDVLSEERLFEAMDNVLRVPLCLYIGRHTQLDILCHKHNLRIVIHRIHKGEWIWRVWAVVGPEKVIQI